MASQFFSGLLSGSYTQPDSVINAVGPLPSLPAWAPPQIHGIPDGEINQRGQLLSDIAPYAYGANPARISTQTQMAHPNKVQLVIPRLFIPAAMCAPGCVQDPILEHAVTDGDLVFSLHMNMAMQSLGRQYCIIPYSNSYKSMKLLNLATVNYLLWGLQVGTALTDGRDWRWRAFFSYLCMGQQKGFEGGNFTAEVVWNFLQTYIAPFGVQHGSDMQGGHHEGGHGVSTVASEYVSAFAVEGRLHKVNNLWRCSDIDENDDLVLELTYMPPQSAYIPFSLCSSARANRTENAPVPVGWWYLAPTVLKYKTMIPAPHIHVGRAQKMIAGYGQNKWGLGMPPWNARACAVGTAVLMTFEPGFVMSDAMLERKLTEWVLPGHDMDVAITQRQLADSLPDSDAHILFQDVAATKRLHEAVKAREEQVRKDAEAREALASASAGNVLPAPIAIGGGGGGAAGRPTTVPAGGGEAGVALPTTTTAHEPVKKKMKLVSKTAAGPGSASPSGGKGSAALAKELRGDD